MPKKKQQNVADFIVPLYMNGLQGRMLRLPPPPNKKREILIIYGHHSSIERMFGMAQFFNHYGGVTLPDLPGFGGMQSFHKIGQKPTLDNLVDYLAAFVKLRYKRRHITIVGSSFGFVVATRLLQRYPELAKRVDLLISFVGFVHRDDFKLKPAQQWGMRLAASVGSLRLPAAVLKHTAFQPVVLRTAYNALASKHPKLKNMNKAEQQARIEFETYLWQCNDLRTRARTVGSFLHVDLCDKQVDLPVHHIAVADIEHLDNDVIEQHLKVIYKDAHIMEVSIPPSVDAVMADAESVAPYVPTKLRRILARKP